jgi:hypothetical protein
MQPQSTLTGEQMDKMMGNTTDFKKKKKNPDEERRRWPRLKPSAIPFLKGVSLSQGSEVQAIDISRGGMLLETEVRLRPQMKIHLKLVTSEGVIKIEGCVLRSSITSLTGTPKYQSAIAFEHPFHMLDDLSEESAAALPESQPEPGNKQPENTQPSFEPIVGAFDESSSILTFVAPDIPGTSLLDRFKMNDW